MISRFYKFQVVVPHGGVFAEGVVYYYVVIEFRDQVSGIRVQGSGARDQVSGLTSLFDRSSQAIKHFPNF